MSRGEHSCLKTGQEELQQRPGTLYTYHRETRTGKAGRTSHDDDSKDHASAQEQPPRDGLVLREDCVFGVLLHSLTSERTHGSKPIVDSRVESFEAACRVTERCDEARGDKRSRVLSQISLQACAANVHLRESALWSPNTRCTHPG